MNLLTLNALLIRFLTVSIILLLLAPFTVGLGTPLYYLLLKIFLCLLVVFVSAFISFLLPGICLCVLGFSPTGLRKHSLASWYKSVANSRGWSLKGNFALLSSVAVRGFSPRTYDVMTFVGAFIGLWLAYSYFLFL